MNGKTYTAEFKTDALRMAEKSSIKATSDKLDISEKTLYRWRKEARETKNGTVKGMLPGETAEQAIRRLEKEKAELEEANYILRKAMGFLVDR